MTLAIIVFLGVFVSAFALFGTRLAGEFDTIRQTIPAAVERLGVPAAGGLGVIAGLLDIIPMVGPIIAGVPAVLLVAPLPM